MRRLVTFCVVLALIATFTVTVSAGTTPELRHSAAGTGHTIRATLSKPSREVFGYALGSSLSNASWGYPSWNFSLLSTVAYFGIHINASGVMIDDSDWQTWNSSDATGLITTAHANAVKVLMTVVLQDFSAGTPTMCSALANRVTTVLQAVRAMKARGADGISVDFEGLNGTCSNGQDARSMMTDLVAQFRAALGTGPYLNVATYGSAAMDPIGFFDIAGMAPYADSFFVMAYDLEYSNYHRTPLNCSVFCLGPTAPLSAYYWNDTQMMSDYLGVVPASKIILGVPYYGRKACVSSAVPNAIATSTVVADTYLDALSEAGDPAVRAGSYVTHRDVYDTAGGERWDTWYNSSLGCIRELYFDDALSLGGKYALANTDGLRGVGVWTLNYGGSAPELWAALSDHFATCTGMSATESAASPQPAGTAVHVTAAASGCANPRYEFWSRAPGQAWTLVQPYSTSPSFNWNSAGKAAGTYRFSVWARNGDSTNSYDAFSAFDFALTPTCPAVGATATPPTTTSIGTSVTISASAPGCPNPLYEFWLQNPAGSWSLAQGYSTSAAYNWTTTGKPTGTFRFSVWARNGDSTNSYDAFSAFDFALTPTCPAISATATPPSTTSIGTAVTISASAPGCPNPLYEFWLKDPAGSWSLAQGFSTSSSYHWTTTGKPAGTFRFSVWTRDATSPNAYDSFNAFDYSLTVTPCMSTTATPAPASPAPAGSTVVITAAAAGCANPLYEFWVWAPVSGWTLAQGYSSSATFKWSSAGKSSGSYRFSVWARDLSSAGTTGSASSTYDAFSAFPYTLTPVCSAVSVSAAPASSAKAGSTVTLTAAAAGCPNPVYEFWILAPGGTWALTQAYSTNGTLKWNTAGMAAGSYRISVWVRDAGSPGTGGTPPATYDAFSAFTYSLV
jgi:spore germination protein YaaH